MPNAQTSRPLTDDEAADFTPEQVVGLSEQVVGLNEQVLGLKQQIDWFRRQIFGQKSEKRCQR